MYMFDQPLMTPLISHRIRSSFLQGAFDLDATQHGTSHALANNLLGSSISLSSRKPHA
jgi:hypothetical protein